MHLPGNIMNEGAARDPAKQERKTSLPTSWRAPASARILTRIVLTLAFGSKRGAIWAAVVSVRTADGSTMSREGRLS
jgi:hypothetical protein